jgi:hypothetical protein
VPAHPTFAAITRAMVSHEYPANRILDLEARQDEALRELEALERAIEQVLTEQTAWLTATRVSSMRAGDAA